jgi:Protein of unknown function (DUF3102)
VLNIERGSESDSSVNGVSDFNYASVPTSVAKFLKGQATRIRQYAGKTIVQIGKDLVSAKHYLSHGQFLRWVESEVGIPARTAQAYMQAAQWASNNRETAALLPPSLLYILSSPSTPKEFAEAVARRVTDGEVVSTTTLRAELKAMRGVRRTEEVSDPAVSCSAPLNPTHQDYGMAHPDAALSEVVEILVNSLSRADFSRVCAIMMSNEILHQPDLSGAIRSAFSDVHPANMPTNDDRKPRLDERRLVAVAR